MNGGMVIGLDYQIVSYGNHNISMISIVVNKYLIKEYQYYFAHQSTHNVEVNDGCIIIV
jgi:hypothetical protein